MAIGQDMVEIMFISNKSYVISLGMKIIMDEGRKERLDLFTSTYIKKDADFFLFKLKFYFEIKGHLLV